MIGGRPGSSTGPVHDPLAKTGLEASRVACLSPWQVGTAPLLNDVRMPSAGGPEVSAALSARFPGLRTVYMSGYPSELATPGGELVGHPFFVPKPFTADNLVRHVREALDARLPAPGA